MKIVLFFVFIILISLTSVAYAHGLYLSSKEGRLYAHFSDHSPASGAVVTVVDEDGIEIIRDTVDEKGMWTLPNNIEGKPKFVIVEATGGHLTRIAWQNVLHETAKGFFDYLSVRIAIGVVVLSGGGFFIKRLLNPKSKIRNEYISPFNTDWYNARFIGSDRHWVARQSFLSFPVFIDYQFVRFICG